jgi:hypothetical protein
MEYFAGLDVSVKETSVCVVDGTGKIAREVKVASEPDAFGRLDWFASLARNDGSYAVRAGCDARRVTSEAN